MVSVIVPVYNTGLKLRRCLDSIKNQTYKDTEILIIDDGTTDELTIQICNEFIENDNRINYIHQNNTGVGLARNRGLDEAKGKYILFVDSDDYIKNHMIERMVAEAEANEADIVFCDYVLLFYDEEKKEQSCEINIPIDVRGITDVYRDPLLLCMINPNLWNKLIAKSLFLQNSIRFHDTLCEDTEVIYPLFWNAGKVAQVKDNLYIKDNLDNILSNNIMLPCYITKVYQHIFDVANEAGIIQKLYWPLKVILIREYEIQHGLISTAKATKLMSESDIQRLEEAVKDLELLLTTYFPNWNHERVIGVAGSANLLEVIWTIKCFKLDVYEEGPYLILTVNKSLPMITNEIRRGKYDRADVIVLDLLNADMLLESDFESWRQSCDEFIEQIQRIGKTDQLYIIENYFMKQYGNFEELTSFENQRDIVELNKKLEGYYRYLKERLPQVHVVSTKGCDNSRFTYYYRDVEPDYRFANNPYWYVEMARRLSLQMDVCD